MIRSTFHSNIYSEVKETKVRDIQMLQSLVTSYKISNAIKVRILTHCGLVTQICVFTLQLCKTDDANLRF